MPCGSAGGMGIGFAMGRGGGERTAAGGGGGPPAAGPAPLVGGVGVISPALRSISSSAWGFEAREFAGADGWAGGGGGGAVVYWEGGGDLMIVGGGGGAGTAACGTEVAAAAAFLAISAASAPGPSMESRESCGVPAGAAAGGAP